jgi:hypothetical protein
MRYSGTKDERATRQFLVPPIYSGKLKVGLATTAPAEFELDEHIGEGYEDM